MSSHLENPSTRPDNHEFAMQDISLNFAYYQSEIVGLRDYYTFGMQMQERNTFSKEYRFGFGGMEKDDELKGMFQPIRNQTNIY